jgi:hypothetical protein
MEQTDFNNFVPHHTFFEFHHTMGDKQSSSSTTDTLNFDFNVNNSFFFPDQNHLHRKLKLETVLS